MTLNAGREEVNDNVIRQDFFLHCIGRPNWKGANKMLTSLQKMVEGLCVCTFNTSEFLKTQMKVKDKSLVSI